jgi:NodT family efflux transporter outer membrane factor (OMF) lipoprotein
LLHLKSYYYLILSSALMLGCTVGPDFQSPEPPKTTSYTMSPIPQQTVEIKGQENKTQKFLFADNIRRQWWTLFECEPLNRLIRQGLQNSPTLQAAQASLRQAEENLKGGMGGFFPAVDAQLSGSRQKESKASSGLNTPPPIFNLFNTSLNVSYSPDIFGALRHQVEALEAQVDFQQFELEAAYLTLTSSIVITAIQEASLRCQIDVTKELIASQEKQLRIIKQQLQLGAASETDILAQEVLIGQTRATLPPLEISLAQTRHALAILVGSLPSEANLPYFRLENIHLPTDLPITLPSHLVQNRPDIKAAEALLQQANAQIGVAKANMFPQFTLTGSIGGIASQPHSLFAGSSNVWTIASQLLQPIFRGGAMIAKENASIAAYEQAFASYRQMVLKSFQQVTDVLQALVEDAKTFKTLEASEKAAYRSLKISQKQYQLGAVSFLMLLNAERQYQQTQIARIKAETTRYMDTAALFQALGGDCFSHRQQKSQESRKEPQKTRPVKESAS